MAGNAGAINEVVSPVAVKQVTELEALLAKLEIQFVATAKQADGLIKATGGATSFSGFTKAAAESDKATKKVVENQEKIRRTIISNSQAEVDAYEKSKRGQEGIISTVNKRNQAEAKAANEATIRNAKIVAQQEQQAKEYVRAQGLIEKLTLKLKFYKQAQIEALDPRVAATYAKKIQDTERNITQLSNAGKDGFDSLGNAVKKSGNLFQTIGQKVVTLARILPGIGVVGLIAFATEPILEYIQTLDLFKAKLSTTAEVQKTINDVNKEANKDAATQLTNLKYIYAAATDVNNSMHDRLKAAKELQKEYPTTFGLQTQENIINGEASGIYQQLTTDIIKNARAKAAAAKISEETAKILDAEIQKEKVRIANENENIKTQKQLDDARGQLASGRGGGIRGVGLPTRFANELKQNNDRTAKELKTQDNLIKTAQNNIKAIENIVGGGSAVGNGLVTPTGGENKGGKKDTTAEDASKDEDEAQMRALEDRKRYLDAILNLEAEAAKEAAEQRKKDEADANSFASGQNSLRLLEIEKNKDAALNALAEQYAQGKIKKADYDNQVKEIENTSALESIDSAIKLSSELIEINKSFGKDTISEEEKLAKLQIQYSGLVRDNKIKDLELEAAKRKELNAKIKELAEDAAEFVIQLVDAGFTNRKNVLQKEADEIDKNTQLQIAAVEKSVLTEQQKADQISVINAKAQADKELIAQKQRQIDVEKAKFDKAIAIARIIENTAIGISSALASLPPNIPLAFIVGAIGAVQLATAIATPIPAFKDGGTMQRTGVAKFGERGTELRIDPDGTQSLTPDTETMGIVKAGTKFISNRDLMQIIAKPDNKFVGGQVDDRLLDEMRKQTNIISKSKPVHGTILTSKGVKGYVGNTTKWNNYLKRNGVN